jgi:exodeoxyribonuclease-3
MARTLSDTISKLTVATWNVNGIRAREAQLLEWIGSTAPDVFCLQEIKASLSQLPPSLVELPDYWSYWHGASGGYSGVSLHFRKEKFPGEPEFLHPPFDRETRIVQATIDGVVFSSVYIPNGGKDYRAKLEFLKEMEDYIAGIHDAGSKLILCGDMNITRTDMDIHPSQNKPGIIGTRPDERELFERMIGQGLVDVARMLEPENDRLYTWWPFWRTARQRNLGWRLDYIFATKSLAKKVAGCTVMREVGTSDHAPVVAEFTL